MTAEPGPGKREHASVLDRIEGRIRLLRTWSVTGVPKGVAVPRSLAACRRWDDPDHGVSAIASPNAFTKGHPRYGTLVEELEGLLAALAKAGHVSRGRDAEVADLDGRPETHRKWREARVQYSDTQAALTAAVSQWQAERAEATRWRIACEDARRRLKALR